MRTRTTGLSVVGAAILVAVTSMSAVAVDEAEPDVGAVEGVTWILTRQATEGELADLSEGILVSMRLEGAAAGGSGGCNSWFADYTLEADRLTFTEIGSTLIACDEPADTVERTFFANLGAVATFGATETQLSLVDESGRTILVFEADDPGTVVGSWVATGIAVGGGVMSSATTSRVTAEFAEDGRIRGHDGCGTYDGAYELDGPRISFGPLATTEEACPDDELAKQADAYAEALAAAVLWSVEPDGSLHLRDAEGALLISYARVER